MVENERQLVEEEDEYFQKTCEEARENYWVPRQRSLDRDAGILGCSNPLTT